MLRPVIAFVDRVFIAVSDCFVIATVIPKYPASVPITVFITQGDLEIARALLQRHFAIRSKLDEGDINPYGLIAVANLLVAEGKFKEAVEANFVCKRLMSDMKIIPDPADEAVQKANEEICMIQLSPIVRARVIDQSANLTCRDLVANRII